MILFILRKTDYSAQVWNKLIGSRSYKQYKGFQQTMNIKFLFQKYDKSILPKKWDIKLQVLQDKLCS